MTTQVLLLLFCFIFPRINHFLFYLLGWFHYLFVYINTYGRKWLYLTPHLTDRAKASSCTTWNSQGCCNIHTLLRRPAIFTIFQPLSKILTQVRSQCQYSMQPYFFWCHIYIPFVDISSQTHALRGCCDQSQGLWETPCALGNEGVSVQSKFWALSVLNYPHSIGK